MSERTDNPYAAPKQRDEQQPTPDQPSRVSMVSLLLALILFAGALLMWLSARTGPPPAPPVPIRPQVVPENVRTIGPEAQP